MDDEFKFDLQKLIQTLNQRKGLTIAVFAVIFSLATYFAYSLPDKYKSTAMILFVPQVLPDSFVESAVTHTMQERIYAVTRNVLSRSRLKNIIKELDLYSNQPALDKGDRIKKMRKNIDVDAEEGTNEFTISFESRIPINAQKVAARLASAYVDETRKKGEEQAKETTAFLQVEAEGLKREVERLEQGLNRYKAKHRYDLPEQLPMNLMTLERIRTELQTNLLYLAAIRESKASLETELTSMRGQGGEAAFTKIDHIVKKQLELETALSKYGDRHPTVINLKREIEAIESGKSIEGTPAEKEPTVAHSERYPLTRMLLTKIRDLETETKTLQGKNKLILEKITVYQTRVNNTSARATELAKIARTYDVTRQKYNRLYWKLLDSKLSESMEMKSKATRFQILYPAYLPDKPSGPNRRRILIMGLMLGLAAGFGLSILLDVMSTTIKSADELKATVDLPLLASIPLQKTRGSIMERRRQQLVVAVLCVTTLGLGAALIRYYSQHIY